MSGAPLPRDQVDLAGLPAQAKAEVLAWVEAQRWKAEAQADWADGPWDGLRGLPAEEAEGWAPPVPVRCSETTQSLVPLSDA